MRNWVPMAVLFFESFVARLSYAGFLDAKPGTVNLQRHNRKSVTWQTSATSPTAPLDQSKAQAMPAAGDEVPPAQAEELRHAPAHIHSQNLSTEPPRTIIAGISEMVPQMVRGTWLVSGTDTPAGDTAMKAPIRIAVVDDHPLFREGVTRSLSDMTGFEIVGQGASAADAIRIVERLHPDVLLMDISMPGGGLSAIHAIRSENRDQKIIVLSVSESNSDVGQALNEGVQGYVLKGVSSRSLAEIIRNVAAGETYVSASLSARLLSDLNARRSGGTVSDPLAQLTDRETETLGLVADGLSNKEIAIRLNLQEKTVKHHMTRILAKLNVRNRTEAALYMREHQRA